MAGELKLQFYSGQLAACEFFHPVIGERRKTVRGKTSGAIRKAGTFQWTTAVWALSMVFVKMVLDQMSFGKPRIALSGGKGSLALSLDYAISKECLWLQDMFGSDPHGRMVASRLIKRSNSHCKRPGPVIVSLNETMLAPEKIEIEIDGTGLPSVVQLEELLRKIESSVGQRRGMSQWISTPLTEKLQGLPINCQGFITT